MIQSANQGQQKIAYRLVQRSEHGQITSKRDAFVICAPEFLDQWQRLGNVLVLVPGLSTYQAVGSQGVPLIIDESALLSGAWAGSDSSIGERRVSELEEFAAAARSAGGICVYIQRGYRVPNVNLERFRALGDISINLSDDSPRMPEPSLIQQIRTVLESERC